VRVMVRRSWFDRLTMAAHDTALPRRGEKTTKGIFRKNPPLSPFFKGGETEGSPFTKGGELTASLFTLLSQRRAGEDLTYFFKILRENPIPYLPLPSVPFSFSFNFLLAMRTATMTPISATTNTPAMSQGTSPVAAALTMASVPTR
jgi:hypothetical protein